MMLRVVAFLLSFAVVGVVGVGQADACKCKPVSRIQAFDTAHTVFYGAVIDTDKEDHVRLKVRTSYKRTKRNRKVKIYRKDDSCDFEFEADKKYLVFASRSEKKLYVDVCNQTQALDYTPINSLVWTLSDDMSYGLTKKERGRAESQRNKLSDHAEASLKKAVRKCDKAIWKSKKNVKGHIEVRFDHLEKRNFSATILKYERSEGDDEEITACVAKKLAKVKFPKFDGGPISIHAYRILDQVDPMIVRKKSNAKVIKYEPVQDKDVKDVPDPKSK